jgi:hypothetical protein
MMGFKLNSVDGGDESLFICLKVELKELINRMLELGRGRVKIHSEFSNLDDWVCGEALNDEKTYFKVHCKKFSL